MTIEFNLNDPRGNEILVYDEITKKFVNTSVTSILPPPSGIQGAMNMGEGLNIYNDTVSNQLRFRGIKGSDGISVNYEGSDINIKFNGNASTIAGQPLSNLVLVSNNLNDVDPLQARSNLGVMSIQESMNSFMEANASNIPDVDNKYDLGANGRRFADMYAVTFHGLATEAIVARGLARNGASDGQILVWRTADNKWMPEDSTGNRLNSLEDVDISNLANESVLVYNGVLNRWETVPSSFFGGGTGEGGDVLVESIGTGVSVVSNKLGNLIQFRTLKAADNTVSVTTNFNGEEVLISANVPQTTDDLTEGTSNLYFTPQRALDAVSGLSLQDLDRTTGSPIAGQAPIWNGSTWTWGTVSVNINTTDDLPEGTSNLYFTTTRADLSISNYISNPSKGITLTQLKDVNASPTDGYSLVFDTSTNNWVSKMPSITKVSGFDLSGIADGNVMKWDAVNNKFIPTSMPSQLIGLGETADSLHFNQAVFDSFFSAKNTDSLPDTSTNMYLNAANLNSIADSISVGAFSGMNLTGVSDGNIMVWDAASSSLVPADSESLNVTVSLGIAELNDVDSTSMANIATGQILEWDGTKFIAADNNNSLIGLDDVNVAGMTNNQALVWNAATTKFIPKNIVTFEGAVQTNDLLQWDGSAFTAVSMASLTGSLLGLSDVTATNLVDKDILFWNNITSEFNNAPITDLVPTTVNAMDDVSAGTIAPDDTLAWNGTIYETRKGIFGISGDTHSNGDILFYDNSGFRSADVDTALNISGTRVNNSIITVNGTGNLEYKPMVFSNISDIDTTNVNNGTVGLVYDSVAGYTAKNLVMNDIMDVNISNIQVDQILQWNGSVFINKPLNVPTTINDLSDVEVNTPQLGEVLSWTGSAFTNIVFNPVSSINDLNDVDITTIADGQLLVWDATTSTFVAETYTPVASIGDLTDVDETVVAQAGDVLTYNTTTGKYEPSPVNQTPTSLGGVYERIASQGQIVFAIPHNGTVMVWAGGILLPDAQVDLTNPAQVTLSTARNAGDTVRFMVLADANDGVPTNASVYGTTQEFIATQGQTDFVIAHNQLVMVFAGGIALPESEYNTNNLSKVVLNTARNANDVVKIVVLQS